MKKIKLINVQLSTEILYNFAIILLILQVVIIIAMGIFVRMNLTVNNDPLDQERYLTLESINVMMLIGFGYLMATLRTNSFSGLAYTLFVNALSLQLYVLFQGFWNQIFSAFNKDFYIYVDQKLLIRGSYCVVSGLIALSSVIGRINPTEIIKISLFHVAAYSLNQYLVYNVLGAYDAGGSTTVHIFGAYFGIAASLVLVAYSRPCTRPEKTYNSSILAMIGTLLLWVYWPAFNFGVYATTTFQRTQIIGNTIFSLVGSSLATFIVSSMHGRGILIEDIQHASIVGGVAIGASAGILYLPFVALLIGFLAGVISTNAFHYLNKKLEKSLKLFDVHGVHSTHGLPGIFGGVASAIIVAIYHTGYDSNVAALYFKDSNNNTFFSPTTDFLSKGGLQMAAVGISFGIAVISGVVVGKFIGLFYAEKYEQFYEDCTYFDHALFLNNQRRGVEYKMEEIRVPYDYEREEVKRTEPMRTGVEKLETSRKLQSSPQKNSDQKISSQRTNEVKSFRERERDKQQEDAYENEKTPIRKSKREIRPN